LVAAVFLAAAALSGSTTPASAASLQGFASFTSAGWVQCGDFWVYTYINGSVHWVLHSTVLHNGTYWALDHVSAMVEIHDPYPIREECGPYRWTRLFSLENSSRAVVASNQTATASAATPGCLAYTIDPTEWSMANGCHLEPYYFKYTHPAGYIYYGASVFLTYGAGGYAGNTGWKSLGG
jgi:hypothetical protein